jgi:hypothetical protein
MRKLLNLNKILLKTKFWNIKYVISLLIFLIGFFLFSLKIFTKESPLEIYRKSIDIKEIPPHTVVRFNQYHLKNLSSQQELVFLNLKKLKLTMLAPESLKGIVSYANGKELIYYVPKMKSKMVFPLNRTEFGPEEIMGVNVSLPNIIRNYNISFLKVEDVIGRTCNVIKIESKNPPKRSKILWIDKEKNVVLKEEKYYGNKLYSSSICKKISYAVPSEEEIEPEIGIAITVPSPQREEYYSLAKAIENCSWKFGYPSYLPQGFYLEKVRIRKSVIGDEVILYFTDGLTRVDITEKKKTKLDIIADKIISLTEDFYVYSGGWKIEKETEDIKMHIYGELPLDELKKIINSLKF